MNRRTALQTLAAVLAAPALHAQEPSAPHPLTAAWEAWKAVCLAPDGRVVDELQSGASHSESQGYGLLLAATLGDVVAFDLIDGWTMVNLAVRPDNLLAWRWLPDGAERVADLNNASDGDLFYAWALIRAAETLGRPELIDRATAIARDLAAACILSHPDGRGRLIFTPAATGFAREGGSVINFSYYMPLAMRDVAAATGIGAFAAAAGDGETMMADLTADGLVPDWITVGPMGFFPDAELGDQNGFEAMRVSPFLIWSGRADHPAVVRQAEALARATGDTPTVMDRFTFEVRETSADPGYAAIAGLVACAAGSGAGAAIPRFSADQPYYPATLHMFTLLAQIEASPSCMPI